MEDNLTSAEVVKEDIVENINDPIICYKVIKTYDNGEIEEEVFSHVFKQPDINEDNTHNAICERCGYVADFEWEVEDDVNKKPNKVDATVPVTPFSLVYDNFLSKITDDMYMELTELDTFRLLEELLLSAIHKFEFPRFNITDYEEPYVEDESTYKGVETNGVECPIYIYSGGGWNVELTPEEINIISTYMIVEWLGQQLASVENVRMKYSGSDFKFTSQANHMAKILSLKKDYEREGFHLQRLYKRRLKDEKGIMHSTFDTIMEDSPQGRDGGMVIYEYNKISNRYRR